MVLAIRLQKLNVAHAHGGLLLSGVVGLAAGSWGVFLAAVAVLVAGACSVGDIRPRPRRR